MLCQLSLSKCLQKKYVSLRVSSAYYGNLRYVSFIVDVYTSFIRFISRNWILVVYLYFISIFSLLCSSAVLKNVCDELQLPLCKYTKKITNDCLGLFRSLFSCV